MREVPDHRLGLLVAVAGLFAGVLIVRLVDLQFFAKDRVLGLVERRFDERMALPAVRGTIRDRFGRVLAEDIAAFRVSVAPALFRERSAIECALDLEVFAGIAAPTERAARRRQYDDVETRRRAIQALLAVPAGRFFGSEEDRLQRGSPLLRPDGELIRRPSELAFRVRHAFGRLLGATAPLRAARARSLAQSKAPIGASLDLTAEALTERITAEITAIQKLSAALWPEPEAEAVFWREFAATLDREWDWIESRLAGELEKAARIERFGVEHPSAATIGSEAWAALAEEIGLSHRRASPDGEVALRAAGLRDALVAARFPAGEPMVQGTPEPGSDEREREEALRLAYDRAVKRLQRDSIFDGREATLLEAWYARRRARADFAEHARWLLSDRRRNDLIAGLRGGRGFALGQGQGVQLAPLVWGVGGLEELGFELEPIFDRSRPAKEALSPSLRLLVGEVGRRERNGISGLEASLNARIRGEDGAAGREGAGPLRVLREPVHGANLDLSLSVELCGDLERILREAAHDTPAALAVIEVQTGAILGLASWPELPDADAGLLARLDFEAELRQIDQLTERLEAERDLAWIAQREALLGADEAPFSVRERALLKALRKDGKIALERRRLAIRTEMAQHGAWHRALENPGYSGPGSVFKALTILAGLELDPELGLNSTFDCGFETERRSRHSCHAHGLGITVERALQVSCNEYCYQVGMRLGAPALVDFFGRAGLFEPVPGLLPGAPSWYLDILRRADPRNLSIGGQGVSCVPVRAAGIAASIAMGRQIVPWIVGPPPEPGAALAVNPQHLAAIHEGMRLVSEPGGTAARTKALRRLRVAAKTGTSDYPVRLLDGTTVSRNEAWFVGFAPYEAPRFAFAALISRTTLQGARAAPMAAEALEATAARMGGAWW